MVGGSLDNTESRLVMSAVFSGWNGGEPIGTPNAGMACRLSTTDTHAHTSISGSTHLLLVITHLSLGGGGFLICVPGALFWGGVSILPLGWLSLPLACRWSPNPPGRPPVVICAPPRLDRPVWSGCLRDVLGLAAGLGMGGGHKT